MLSDLRLSLRALAKSPTFTVVAVFTIVLGIGVNAAMFSIVNAIMFRGLPFPQPDRLVHLEQRNPVEQIDGIEIAYQDFVDYRAGQTTLQGLAAYYDGTLTLSGPGQDPVRVEGTYISAGGPEMLGVPPSLGRWFRAEEDNPGAPPVIVLGHSYWRNHYKSDPAVVGRPLRINGEWGTIIGVGPVDYRFPEVADAWVPLRYKKTDEKRDVRFLEVLGRLKEGATLGLAQAEFATLNQRLVAAHPVTNKNLAAVVKPLQVEFVGDDTRRLLFIMLGAVFFVLLIACANVANLLLARAATREKEMAIRTAVGAGRGRIIRLLLADSTNADQPGHSRSETSVGKVLYNLMHEQEGRRVITACFASHIHRIQQLADAAISFDRKIAPLGRSPLPGRVQYPRHPRAVLEVGHRSHQGSPGHPDTTGR